MSSQVETCEPSFFHPMQEPAHHIPLHTIARIPLPELHIFTDQIKLCKKSLEELNQSVCKADSVALPKV